MSRHQSWTKVLQMKCNYGKIIQIPTGLLLHRFQGSIVCFCLVQVCPIVSVRGKTPISHDSMGLFTSHQRQEAVKKLFRMEPVQVESPVTGWRNAWYEIQEGTQAAWFVTDKLQRHSQVPNLSICGHLSNGWRAEVREIHLHFLFESFKCLS